METKIKQPGSVKFDLCRVPKTNDADFSCFFWGGQFFVQMPPLDRTLNMFPGPGGRGFQLTQ